MTRIHAGCVALGGCGVLIAGPSGSGKSDLALRLIDRGATLVSDDYSELAVEGAALVARAPAAITGQIEVRGLGVLPLPALPAAPIALYLTAGVPERMPEQAIWTMLDVAIPMLTLSFLEPSAPLKVELALKALR